MTTFYISVNGKTTIRHHDYMRFLGEKGFSMMEFPNGRKQLVRIIDNIVESATENDLVSCTKDYLIKAGELEALEVFIKGVNSFTTSKKLEFLPAIKSISDKDPKDTAWFYFKNTAVKIIAGAIDIVPYASLTHPIWKNRILERSFIMPNSSQGQFYRFLYLISKEDLIRYQALQTAMGYLLHRYNNPSLPKAIILLDEKISFDGTANGGTGKGVLALALGHCKNLEVIDGQQLKSDSRFKNQRIDVTTDIILFDDVSKKFTLDDIKSMITSGITVEKKGKDEVHISAKDAPKLMISSNYIVGGTGGSTDLRRRYEFEVADYFSNTHTPINEFGNLFFDEWDHDEWNMFDLLMMECVQQFLQCLLVEPPNLNLTNNKVMCITNPEFKLFSSENIVVDTWQDKDLLFSKFKSENLVHAGITSHQFTKWVKEYAKIHELTYDSKSPGGVQQFILKSNLNLVKDEEQDTPSL